MKKAYKKKLDRPTLEGLVEVVNHVMASDQFLVEDDDRLWLAVLIEIRTIADKRLYNVQSEYTISFSPAQAFALRILFTDYVQERTSYMGNKLHTIALEVHELYQ